METLQAINQRRSIRDYDPNYQMPEQDKRQLLELAMLSPTSFNMQNWRFVLVEDPAIREQICQASWKQKQIVEASLLIVVTADLKAWSKDPERYWRNFPEENRKALVQNMKSFYSSSPVLERDEAMRSAGIASQTIMLAAKSMGYDSNPIVGSDFNKVGKIINLPEGFVICLLLVVGKTLSPPLPRGGQLPHEEVVVRDRFATTAS